MIPQNFTELWSTDRAAQNAAYQAIMAETAAPVAWAYAAWDEVVAHLASADNHDRAIAAQLLCNLAKSDPDRRILADFPALMAVTGDARFVTARHALQSMWKVGAAGPAQRQVLVAALSEKFSACTTHKNCTLIRFDILQSLRKIADATGEQDLRPLALKLIEMEHDPKYRKKYATLWR